MVSQRQKLARKRYKEAHPELFPKPKPEPTQPKDPNKKEKKSKFKRKKSDKNGPNKPKKLAHKKHPFRVPGMKPGESCFICKAPDHIAKDCPKKSEWEKNKTCLFCRQRGHSLKNCPNKSEEMTDKKLCYNCGETGHSLDKCPQPLQDGGTRFAKCFVCNQIGHLSRNCLKNAHGIYPKGGCCKICGGVTHLAKDCPDKQSKASRAADQAFQNEEIPNRITKFVSGDDLEDDFMTLAPSGDDKDKSVKSKKNQGPKVVNFVG